MYASPVRRTLIAAAWIAATAIPLLVSIVFTFGCCVLPFHRVMHRIVPLCDLVMRSMNHDDDRQQPLPAREKQEPARRVAGALPGSVRLPIAATVQQRLTQSPVTDYRSFISLGAVRCDRDVGLHLWVVSLLI